MFFLKQLFIDLGHIAIFKKRFLHSAPLNMVLIHFEGQSWAEITNIVLTYSKGIF